MEPSSSDAALVPLRPLPRRIASSLARWLRQAFAALVLAALALVGLRAWQSTQGPPLRPWHTLRVAEPSAEALAGMDWTQYVLAESAVFADTHRRLQRQLRAADRTPLNRYQDGSLSSPLAFDRDWNRSFVLEPDGEPRGVVVLLHGLTDSPYSLRALAQAYRAHGFVAIAPRMPGHGTVPGALTGVGRREWRAVVAIAMREAHRRAGGKRPVQVVAYSNGAALALQYVLTHDDAGVERLVLLSPMIEVSGSARFVGLAGLPAFFSRYAKAAWLELKPEYNPFKYNSFPVRAARESYLATTELHDALDDAAARSRLPPILAFQSVLDDTVDAQGIVRVLDRLPASGSALVLYDINRSRLVGPMLRPGVADWAATMLSGPARGYAVTLIGSGAHDAAAIARTRAAGATTVTSERLGVAYPDDVHSLSHIALPFRADDPLYGHVPSSLPVLQLGSIAVRGERDALVVSQENLGRLSWNPFYDDLERRVLSPLPVGEGARRAGEGAAEPGH